jgi:hypothetical protein
VNAEEIIWNALRGALVTRALGLAADLGVARARAAGPQSVEERARRRGADADALYRVLRALASDGIFEETEPPADPGDRPGSGRRTAHRAG